MKAKISIFTFIIFFLTSCAQETASPAADNPVTETPVVKETVTETPPATPTDTPTITPVEVDYFDMTPEERLEQSLGFVEQANGYGGEVSFVADQWARHDYTAPFWWSPSLNQWVTTREFTTGTGGVDEAEIDKTGESFFVAAGGWENPDGSLVFVHPETGVQINLPGTITFPGLGEISIRDLMNMSPAEINNAAIDSTLVAVEDPNEDLYKMQEVMRIKGTAFPGFVIETRDLFPISSAVGNDIPERFGSILEEPTDMVAMPIFNPQTGDFMLWAIFQRGQLASVAEFMSQNGNYRYDFIRFGNNAFGSNGSNFGIFMEYSGDNKGIAYFRGGGDQTVDGSDQGMGDIDTIIRLMNARTEEEIISILAEQGIIWSVPSAVLYEVGQ